MRREIPPNRKKLAVVYGIGSFIFAIGLSSYIQTGLETEPIQVNFLNNLIVVDGILLGFFSVLMARDFEKDRTDPFQRRTDLIVGLLLLFSLFGSIAGVSQVDRLLDRSILGAGVCS